MGHVELVAVIDLTNQVMNLAVPAWERFGGLTSEPEGHGRRAVWCENSRNVGQRYVGQSLWRIKHVVRPFDIVGLVVPPVY